MKTKFFYFRVPIYNLDVYVSYGQKDNYFFRRMEKEGYGFSKAHRKKLLINDNEHGVTDTLYDSNIIIRLGKSNDKKVLRGTIIHEGGHAGDYMLDEVGIKPVIGVSDEAFTYLKEYICTEIFKRLKL